MLDENYYQITGWMLNRLGLKGVQLNVYAIIYGFSQDGETEFQGCVQYLCDACGVSSRNTIRVALNKLVEKGYILRREEYINNVKYVRYKASLEALSFGGGSQNLSRGIANFDHNNNINNNNYNDINITVEIVKKEFEALWKMYPNKTGKRIAYQSYGKARIRSDSPCTFEQVKKGIESYCSKVKNFDTKYIKRGDNYFKGECWNDEYSDNSTYDPDIEKYNVMINKF